jgi:lysophospholipase L1-like esterase
MLSSSCAKWGTLCALIVGLSLPARAQFPLKDGDVWVMAGDSITAQHLHSNYFEAFCYARYPKLKFAFRNSGVGGHTIPTTLARFEYDIAAWKPTVVSVELGMNDKGGTETPKFIANMKTMVERIRSIDARPVIFAASPVNDGGTMKSLAGNKRLHEYAVALKNFCAKEQIPYADQFHALIDLWGHNKPYELTLNSLPMLKTIASKEDIAGVEHIRAFLAAQEKAGKKLVSMQGDPVHPGPPGQLMMAAALLKELGAEPFVSSAVIRKGNVEVKGCVISNLEFGDTKISFERLDECVPFPIPDAARDVLPLYPTILELSQYTLTVPDLKHESYLLQVNGASLAKVSAQELAKGINLTAYGTLLGKVQNPFVLQSRAIYDAIAARALLVGQWRGLSKQAHEANARPELKEQLAVQTKKVEEGDEKIRLAARPRTLRFELTPAVK